MDLRIFTFPKYFDELFELNFSEYHFVLEVNQRHKFSSIYFC